jgi:hypothetical protein
MKKICEYDHKSSKGKHFVVPDEACEVRLTRARKEEEEEEDG